MLEGIDGAGKSTLRDAVARRLADLNVVPHSREEIAAEPGFAREAMVDVDRLLRRARDPVIEELVGVHHWLYLQGLWYVLASKWVVEPKLAAGARLLVDGWHYKFCVKLRLQGIAAMLLDAVFQPATEPDLVVLLDPDVAAVWGRKRFRPAEMGAHEERTSLSCESFIAYQSRVRDALAALGVARGWIVLPVAAGERPDDTADRVASAIRTRLDARS